MDAAVIRPGDHAGDVSSQIEDEEEKKSNESGGDAFDQNEVDAQQKEEVDWQWIFLQEKMEGEP